MKRPWQPRSERWLNLMGIPSVGPEEQHPVILRTDVNIATFILRWEDAQYSTVFLKNKIILHGCHSIDQIYLFLVGIRYKCSSTNNLCTFTYCRVFIKHFTCNLYRYRNNTNACFPIGTAYCTVYSWT